MKLFAAILLLLLPSASRAADSTLVLIAEDARRSLGPLFSQWEYIVRNVETNNPGGVVVVELPRWDRNWTNQNWTALNAMSNAVAQNNPKAVFIVGSLPYCVLGGWNPDGHEWRAEASDQWLGISDFSASDTVTWTDMVGYNASSLPLNRNIPGDGRPDQTMGTYARRVGRVDFANLGAPFADPQWGPSIPCLSNLFYNPAVTEAAGLSNYFRSNIDYRLGRWTTGNIGAMSGGFDSTEFTTASSGFASLSWTNVAGPYASPTALIMYDTWDGYEIHYAYGNGACTPPRYLFNFNTRSYGMEVFRDSQTPMRRLAPGREPNPYALVFGWNYPSFIYWRVSSTNVVAGDIIQSSAAAIGWIDLGLNFYGDPTLPIRPSPPKSSRGVLNVTSITFTNVP